MAKKSKKTPKNEQVECNCDGGYVYYGSGCSMQCERCKGTGWRDAKKKNGGTLKRDEAMFEPRLYGTRG